MLEAGGGGGGGGNDIMVENVSKDVAVNAVAMGQPPPSLPSCLPFAKELEGQLCQLAKTKEMED